MDPDLIRIFGGLFLALLAATLGGQLLRWQFSRGGGPAVIERLNARIRGWWVMIVLLAITFMLGKGAVVWLFAFASFSALREFLTLTRRSRADHSALVASFFVVLPIQYVAVWRDWYGFYAIFIPVYAFLGLPILSVIRARIDHYLSRVAQTQWALMIAVFCMSHVPALLVLRIPGYEDRSLMLIVFLLIVVQSGDLLQFVWDRLLGRREIAPEVSRSKTWEGFAGGVLSASLIGAALYWITPFTPLQAWGMALVIAGMGIFGRLVMSAIKRERGVKEWGHLIEGQGGVLDRLNSVVFAAPVFFHLTRFFWQSMPG